MISSLCWSMTFSEKPVPTLAIQVRGRLLPDQALAAAELAAAGRSATRSAGRTGALVLVAEDQPPFLEVVGRHLDRHPVARQRLDPVLFHLAGGVGDDLVPGIELHAITGVGEDFGDQSLELDQLFFSHVVLQVDRRLAWLLVAVGPLFWTAFAMQKSNALYPFGFAAAMWRPLRLLPVAWWSPIITT